MRNEPVWSVRKCSFLINAHRLQIYSKITRKIIEFSKSSLQNFPEMWKNWKISKKNMPEFWDIGKVKKLFPEISELFRNEWKFRMKCIHFLANRSLRSCVHTARCRKNCVCLHIHGDSPNYHHFQVSEICLLD